MKPARILLAEPCPLLRRGITELLQSQGLLWQISATASTGPEAVQQAAAQPLDIVIIDDRMPELDGLEAAAQIMQLRRRAEILIYSSSLSPVQAARVYHSCVCGALLQRDRTEDFLLALEAVHGHHRFRSRALQALCEKAGRSGEVACRLTRREVEVLCLIAQDASRAVAAAALGVARKTVEGHRRNLSRKLGLKGTAALTRYAVASGFVEL